MNEAKSKHPERRRVMKDERNYCGECFSWQLETFLNSSKPACSSVS
jgi:hypothetical protein